jgi:hypothetical protein
MFELYRQCFTDCLQQQAFAEVTELASENSAHFVIAELKA